MLLQFGARVGRWPTAVLPCSHIAWVARGHWAKQRPRRVGLCRRKVSPETARRGNMENTKSRGRNGLWTMLRGAVKSWAVVVGSRSQCATGKGHLNRATEEQHRGLGGMVMGSRCVCRLWELYNIHLTMFISVCQKSSIQIQGVPGGRILFRTHFLVVSFLFWLVFFLFLNLENNAVRVISLIVMKIILMSKSSECN